MWLDLRGCYRALRNMSYRASVQHGWFVLLLQGWLIAWRPRQEGFQLPCTRTVHCMVEWCFNHLDHVKEKLWLSYTLHRKKKKKIVLMFLNFVSDPCCRQAHANTSFIHAKGNSEFDWDRMAVGAFVLSLLHMSLLPSAASSFTAERFQAVVKTSWRKGLAEGNDFVPNLFKKTCGQFKTISVSKTSGVVQFGSLADCFMLSSHSEG